jgi:glycosyltransferase involved in cell wall biosynthesis
VGGNPEIVREGREGLLTPRGDASAMAAALGKLLDDPALATKMGISGRQRVENCYRLDSTIEAYHRLYRELVPTNSL